MKYLGHTVSEAEILPCSDNIKAITDYPQPQTVKQLKRFLGMANFFTRHIQNASQIMQPLFESTKEKKLDWTDECNKAFQTLKDILTSSPILAFPNFKSSAEAFIVVSDASNIAAGTVLMQT